MSDIFSEVDADLRREQLGRVWSRFGIYIIILAVLIVIGVAGWRGYVHWQTTRNQAAGDVYSRLLTDAEAGVPGTVADALTAYAEDAPDGYAMLARFRAATAYAAADNVEAAVSTLQGLADDGSIPALYRDVARVRLAEVMINADDAAGAESAVGALAEDTGNPMNTAAQEMMGLAAYAKDDVDAARRWFANVRDAAGTSQEMQQRARLMLALLDQTTDAPAGDGAATASNPAASSTAASETAAPAASGDGEAEKPSGVTE